MVKNLPDAPQIATNGITGHYTRPNGQRTREDANVRRLRAVCRMFGLGPTAVSKAGGVSQPYASRVLSETDPFIGSAEFYRNLNDRLDQLIAQRPGQFFRVSPGNVRSIERAARDVVEQSLS